MDGTISRSISFRLRKTFVGPIVAGHESDAAAAPAGGAWASADADPRRDTLAAASPPARELFRKLRRLVVVRVVVIQVSRRKIGCHAHSPITVKRRHSTMSPESAAIPAAAAALVVSAHLRSPLPQTPSPKSFAAKVVGVEKLSREGLGGGGTARERGEGSREGLGGGGTARERGEGSREGLGGGGTTQTRSP